MDKVLTLFISVSSQGRLHTALEYLDMAPGEGALDTAVLRDRIYRAGGPELAATAPAPPFPFVAEEIASSPSTQGGLRAWVVSQCAAWICPLSTLQPG
jgi:hypothetical protein